MTEVDDTLAGKTIRCRECHGFGRVEAPRKKLPPKTPAPPTTQQPQPAPKPPADDEFRFRRRSPWPLFLSAFIQLLELLVWVGVVFSTISVLHNWSLYDAREKTVYQQIVNGTYTLVELLAGWMIAFAIHSILKVIQRVIDLCSK